MLLDCSPKIPLVFRDFAEQQAIIKIIDSFQFLSKIDTRVVRVRELAINLEKIVKKKGRSAASSSREGAVVSIRRWQLVIGSIWKENKYVEKEEGGLIEIKSLKISIIEFLIEEILTEFFHYEYFVTIEYFFFRSNSMFNISFLFFSSWNEHVARTHFLVKFRIFELVWPQYLPRMFQYWCIGYVICTVHRVHRTYYFDNICTISEA